MESETKHQERAPAQIKICGLRREEDIHIVNELKPEYIGFVFYEKSKRNVTEEQAERLRNMLSEDIIPVGVFVDADIEFVAGLLKKKIISIAQLHGHESEEYIKKLRRLLSLNSENDDSFSDIDLTMKYQHSIAGKNSDYYAPVNGIDEDETHVEQVLVNENFQSESRRITGEKTQIETHVPKIIKAFLVKGEDDIAKAQQSPADYILFDQGLGSGETFDWDMAERLLKDFPKPYFLAGGLDQNNVREAIDRLKPYAVDISSRVETDGFKDREKIKAFIDAVRR